MGELRVLIVEDDEIARSFVSDILVEDGYEVDAAEDGNCALQILESRTPDLIISDVLMPGLSGIDFFRKVQEIDALHNVPFIFLTCLDDGDAVLRLEELGPDDYLVKPIRPRHLLARVRGKLRRKQFRDKQAERERDRLRDRIRWTLSHELRTPLTVIQGISEILLNEKTPPEAADYQELLQSLCSQSFQLGLLIENFLLVTRIDSGMEVETWKKGVDAHRIAEVVEEASIPWYEKARARNVDFRCESPDELLEVSAYRPHLLEILRQVLDNAFKFADPESPRVRVAVESRDGSARILVRDNGRGVRPEQRDLLFQKLTQLDREVHEQQGSGLGLYIAKQLLDINRGSIVVRDAGGGGTEVELALPLAPAEARV